MSKVLPCRSDELAGAVGVERVADVRAELRGRVAEVGGRELVDEVAVMRLQHRLLVAGEVEREAEARRERADRVHLAEVVGVGAARIAAGVVVAQAGGDREAAVDLPRVLREERLPLDLRVELVGRVVAVVLADRVVVAGVVVEDPVLVGIAVARAAALDLDAELAGRAGRTLRRSACSRRVQLVPVPVEERAVAGRDRVDVGATRRSGPRRREPAELREQVEVARVAGELRFEERVGREQVAPLRVVHHVRRFFVDVLVVAVLEAGPARTALDVELVVLAAERHVLLAFGV